MEIVPPSSGRLACGDEGAGKMPEPDVLFQYIVRELAYEKDMAGLHVMVTAGPTCESIDPVRYITNHSTGKMGYSIDMHASRGRRNPCNRKDVPCAASVCRRGLRHIGKRYV